MSAISTGAFLFKMGNWGAVGVESKRQGWFVFSVIASQVTGFNPKKMTSRPGFTFIEVLMAVSILAILLVGVHKLQSQMVSMSQATRFLTLAPLLAQNRMAELERRYFKDIDKDSGDCGKAFPGYVWSLSMETTDSDVLKKLAYPMRKIEVSVSLNKGERTYRLRTYRAVPDTTDRRNNQPGPS
jgi:type II secretion system protein I